WPTMRIIAACALFAAAGSTFTRYRSDMPGSVGASGSGERAALLVLAGGALCRLPGAHGGEAVGAAAVGDGAGLGVGEHTGRGLPSRWSDAEPLRQEGEEDLRFLRSEARERPQAPCEGGGVRFVGPDRLGPPAPLLVERAAHGLDAAGHHRREAVDRG